jgi:hypothetical protein
MIIELVAALFLAYCIAVALGLTCVRHSWQKHGPTEHLAIDCKTSELTGWKRYWWVCSRCGKKKQAERKNHNDTG